MIITVLKALLPTVVFAGLGFAYWALIVGLYNVSENAGWPLAVVLGVIGGLVFPAAFAMSGTKKLVQAYCFALFFWAMIIVSPFEGSFCSSNNQYKGLVNSVSRNVTPSANLPPLVTMDSRYVDANQLIYGFYIERMPGSEPNRNYMSFPLLNTTDVAFCVSTTSPLLPVSPLPVQSDGMLWLSTVHQAQFSAPQFYVLQDLRNKGANISLSAPLLVATNIWNNHLDYHRYCNNATLARKILWYIFGAVFFCIGLYDVKEGWKNRDQSGYGRIP